jgi:hypothetical protein
MGRNRKRRHNQSNADFFACTKAFEGVRTEEREIDGKTVRVKVYPCVHKRPPRLDIEVEEASTSAGLPTYLEEFEQKVGFDDRPGRKPKPRRSRWGDKRS